MAKMSKTLAALACAAGMALAATPVQAIDFKVKGGWLMNMQYGQNGNFSNKGHQGYDYLEDEFEARSRIDLQLDAAASENLSGRHFIDLKSAGHCKRLVMISCCDGFSVWTDPELLKYMSECRQCKTRIDSLL